MRKPHGGAPAPLQPIPEMTPTQQTQVLIIGAGPVGMTLAMDLAQRGVACIAVEMRTSDTPPSPKCNHVSARTMETFRQHVPCAP